MATKTVTTIHKHAKRRLYLKEHREAKGVPAETMAGRLGIERQSVYRWEAELHRVTPDKQVAYADALGIAPEDLWRPPGFPSLDGMVAGAPDELRATITDIVIRLAAGGR